MAAVIQKIAFSLALIFATNFILTESTVTTTTKFDSYIGVADKLTVPGDRLRVYQAVWGEIRAEGAANLTQIKVFYDALRKGVNSTKADEQEQTAELLALVRDVLIADNGRLLAETLNNNKSQDVIQVALFRSQLYTDYDDDLLNAIFEKAIDAVYPFQSPEALFNALDAIDKKIYVNVEHVFRVRVNWTLYLYWRFLGRGDINDQYVYNAARAIHNLKRNSLYKTLPSVTVRRIDLAFDTFTSSLRHLFNTTNICVENAYYANYYLYFPVNSIGSSSSVPAVLKSGFIDHTAWLNSYANQYYLAEPDNFYLSYAQNGWTLYRRNTDQFLIVQRDTSNAANRYWTPSLRDNKIMFHNYGYYMCATADYNNSYQGFNVKAALVKSLDDPMCQWKVSNCANIF